MTDNKKYDIWNGTSIAYMIGRLITRTNIPCYGRLLSLEEFNNEYNILSGFIYWLDIIIKHIPIIILHTII